MTFIALGKLPRKSRFSVYKNIEEQDLITRLFIVVYLEIKELVIRSERASKKTEIPILEVDALALVDDVKHIKKGAKAFSSLKGNSVPKWQSVSKLNLDNLREIQLHQSELVMKRLIKDPQLRNWISKAATLQEKEFNKKKKDEKDEVL